MATTIGELFDKIAEAVPQIFEGIFHAIRGIELETLAGVAGLIALPIGLIVCIVGLTREWKLRRALRAEERADPDYVPPTSRERLRHAAWPIVILSLVSVWLVFALLRAMRGY